MEVFLSCFPPVCYFQEEIKIFSSYLADKGVKHTVIPYSEIQYGDKDKLYILFNVHAVEVHKLKLPEKYIVIQLEQCYMAAFTSEYINNLRKAVEIWDYSTVNQSYLKGFGINNITLIQVGFIETPLIKQGLFEDDILFIGTPNLRRQHILEFLQSSGLKTRTVNHVWEDKKFSLITKAKINLNIHFNNTSILETIRLMSLLNHGCFVVTEEGLDQELNNEFKKYCVVVKDVFELRDKCKYFIEHPQERTQLQHTFYENFKKTRFSIGLNTYPFLYNPIDKLV